MILSAISTLRYAPLRLATDMVIPLVLLDVKYMFRETQSTAKPVGLGIPDNSVNNNTHYTAGAQKFKRKVIEEIILFGLN